jgi:putrescine aminotransferase
MGESMLKSHLWHGFADMSVVKDANPFLIARGDGCYLHSGGRRYLDATAGLWYCNVGHGRREIADAAHAQMSLMETYSTFGDYSNGPVEELAARLSDLAPVADGYVFFTSGGSDSVDSAIKLIRRYWTVLGQPQRRVIVSRQYAYHGGHMGSTAIGGIALDYEGFGDLITDTVRIGWDSAEELEAVIAELGADRVAAFVLEPVIAAGGVRFPPPGYLERVADICHRNGVLLIADEVVTGFGRCGDWFASKRFGLEPDILVCAKGLTSGYQQLGALIVGKRVSEPFFNGTAGPFYHGYTWSGHATAAAVALANLDIIERESLADNVLFLEKALPSLMAPISEHPLVAELRTGQGLMAAVEFTEAARRHEGFSRLVVAAMRASGVLTRSLVNGEIQFSPPLIAGPEQVQEFVDSLLDGLRVAAAELVVAP